MKPHPLRAIVVGLFLLSFLFPWTFHAHESDPMARVGRSFILSDTPRIEWLQILEYGALTLALFLCWDD